MNVQTQQRLSIAILLVLFWVGMAYQASALPTFARKYQTSCMTCHESFPRLSAVGEAFRFNGFKFLDDELYIKEEPVEMGDDAYKNLWPKNAVWPSDIPGLPPVSFTVGSELDVDLGGSKTARTDFVFPNTIKILGAGAFGENISFFLELAFTQGSSSGGHAHGGGGDDEGVETGVDGWVQFEDLFGIENKLNLRVGTVGMQEMGLFTARDHNRLTVNPYLYSSWAFPSLDDHIVEDIFGGGAVVEASPFSVHAQPGIEINGFGKRYRYALGIINGNGSVSDNNSEKDLYLQLAYKFGGRTFDGTSSDSQSALGGGEPWRDNSTILSLFAYKGTGTIKVAGLEREDDFWRLGLGVKWKHNDFALNAGYILGRNEDPYGPLGDKSVDSRAWFIEGEYFVLPWLTTTARYEGLSLDLDSGIGGLFIQPNQDRQRLILSAKALIRANLSFTLEGRFNTRDERSTRALDKGDLNDDDQISALLSFAF